MPEPNELEQRARARVGKVLDEKYLLERLLGYGGMAAVYAARHRNGNRAAVKILHGDFARDEEVRGRFLHEGYAANKVEHHGAVRVLDDDVVGAGEDKGTAYLVMELLEGESVYARAKSRGGTLSEAEVLAVADDVLDVLAHAHARGIVHRDLKPDNLFLVQGEGRERVKVLDFGIARIADAARRTNAGQTLGTPSYMSPEQARGQRELIDGRSDLFALGATMFRLLTGRRIHDADSATEILVKMATLPAPPIRSIAPSVSPAVAAIIDRALAFERDVRYADAAQMRADVQAARSGAPLPTAAVPAVAPVGFAAGSDLTGVRRDPTAATVAGPVSGTASTQPAPEPLPPTASHTAVVPPTAVHAAAPSTKRPPWLLIGAGAAVVLVLLVLVTVLATRGAREHEHVDEMTREPARDDDEPARDEPTASPKLDKPITPPKVAVSSSAPAKPTAVKSAPVQSPLPTAVVPEPAPAGKGKGKKPK